MNTIALLLISLSVSPEGYDATELLTDHATSDSLSIPEFPGLKECAAGDETLPGVCFFAQWKRPYYCSGDIEFSSESKSCVQFRTEVENLRTEWIDIFLPDVMPRVYTGSEIAINYADHFGFWEPFKRACPQCVELHELTPAEREITGPYYTHTVRWVDVWYDPVHLATLMDSFAPVRLLAFLRPDDLSYKWAEDRNALLAPRLSVPSKPESVTPEWVKIALEYHPGFIRAAERIVGTSGLNWGEWMETHGYIPGDRTPLDMQYTHGLRWASRPYLSETWTGNFGRIMPYDIDWNDVYQEEKRRHFEESRDANALVDRYLEGN